MPEDADAIFGGTSTKALGNIEDHPWLKRQTRLIFARCGTINPASLSDYRNADGLAGLKRALEIGPANILEDVTKSGLRGRGGAGFPAGIKWKGCGRRESQTEIRRLQCGRG